MRGWALALALGLYLAWIATAGAVSTVVVPVPAKSWTDLGAGPLVVEPVDSSTAMRFAIADASPTAASAGFFALRQFQTSSHV